MLEFIGGLLVDLRILGGFILLVSSFFSKYRKYRSKMLIIGLILLVVEITFLDMSALSEAYQNGREAAERISGE